MTSPTPPAREHAPTPAQAMTIIRLEVLRDHLRGGAMDQEKAAVTVQEAIDCIVDLRNSHGAPAALIEELRNDFINIVVGGCTCGTKPPDPALHELNCHYRMAEAGLARIEKHRAALTPLTTPVAEAVTQPITEQGKDAERYRWLKTRINWNDNMVVHGLLTMDQREWTHIDVRPAEERPDSEHIDEYIDSRLAIDAPSSCTGEGKT